MNIDFTSHSPNYNTETKSENKTLPILGIIVFGTLAGGVLTLNVFPELSALLFPTSSNLSIPVGITALFVFSILTALSILALCQKKIEVETSDIEQTTVELSIPERVHLHAPFAYQTTPIRGDWSDLCLDFIEDLKNIGLKIELNEYKEYLYLEIFNSQEEIICTLLHACEDWNQKMEMEDEDIFFELLKTSLVIYETDKETYINFNLRQDAIERTELFKEFLQEAKDFIDKKEPIFSSEALPDLNHQTPDEYLYSLVQTFDGICIGEKSHGQSAAKQILIDNMQMLKNTGIDLLFLEHLSYDTSIQEQLDTYFLQKSSELPPLLSLRLVQMDEEFGFIQSFNSGGGQPQFCNLVIAAKKAGIRVVGIDTSVSYRCGFTRFGADGPERMYGMNYAAAQIIEHEAAEGEKYIALVGATHACEYYNVQGINHLLGIPSVFVEKKKEESQKEITLSHIETDKNKNSLFDVGIFV